MISIAIVTVYGLDKGGTEKFLQTVAVLLPKKQYKVDYYYIQNCKEKISTVKEELLKNSGVNLIPYYCNEIISKKRYIQQKQSNFMEVFRGADIIFTGSCGYPEEPMTFIKNIPIVQSIHYVSGSDNQFNISRVLHISDFSRNMWVKKGGDRCRTELISHPIQIPQYKTIDIRNQLGISKDDFVFGLHQRDNDFIFSDIPLKAYSMIEDEHTAFILCGGSNKYREQAKHLGLKKIFFIDATDSNDIIYSFLEAINVYAHGRYDGELNSTALAEAMYFGLPIVSHPSSIYNGHLEVIKENGFIADSVEEYSNYLKSLKDDKALFTKCSNEAYIMFEQKYNPQVQINKIMKIFDEVLQKPYPHSVKRRLLHIYTMIGNRIKRCIASIS